MANVELSIGGHLYALACADGEEEALQQLGAIVDEQIVSARQRTGFLTENRQLLFAAILLAERATKAENALANAGGAIPHKETPPLISAREIEEVAQRLEGLADRLNAIVQSPS